jgi:hypothetical protein
MNLNDQIKAAQARVTMYDAAQHVCSFCKVVYTGARADHVATDRHQRAAEAVHLSMNTYQGEADKDDGELVDGAD